MVCLYIIMFNKSISLKHNLTVSSCRHLLEYLNEVMIVLHLDLQPSSQGEGGQAVVMVTACGSSLLPL